MGGEKGDENWLPNERRDMSEWDKRGKYWKYSERSDPKKTQLQPFSLTREKERERKKKEKEREEKEKCQEWTELPKLQDDYCDPRVAAMRTLRAKGNNPGGQKGDADGSTKKPGKGDGQLKQP
jgi:hypothetical protein